MMREAKPSANQSEERKQMTELNLQDKINDLNTLNNILDGMIIDTTPKAWYKRAASAASTNIKTRSYSVKGKLNTLTASVKSGLYSFKDSISNIKTVAKVRSWLFRAYDRIAHFVHQHTVVRLFFYMLAMMAALAAIFTAIWVLITWALAAAEAVLLMTGSVFLSELTFFVLYVGGIVGAYAIIIASIDM
jgi:nitrogen fixation/metabolism regulation signal transduction histidine kinase